jgi:hypothetical protein
MDRDKPEYEGLLVLNFKGQFDFISEIGIVFLTLLGRNFGKISYIFIFFRKV